MLIVGAALLYGVVAQLDGHAELYGNYCEAMLAWLHVVPKMQCVGAEFGHGLLSTSA
jgi:hypothetical protein